MLIMEMFCVTEVTGFPCQVRCNELSSDLEPCTFVILVSFMPLSNVFHPQGDS